MFVQLRACATATAVRCLPTPAGPAKRRLGGSVPPATDRVSRSTSRTWPTTSLKGIVGCYHALAALFLRRSLRFVLRRSLRVGVLGLAIPAEQARPETTFLFLRRRGRVLHCRRRRA